MHYCDVRILVCLTALIICKNPYRELVPLCRERVPLLPVRDECDCTDCLVAGIQQYLFENARIDNIFTDFYFEKFTGCLNELLTNYTVRLNAQGRLAFGSYSPRVNYVSQLIKNY